MKFNEQKKSKGKGKRKAASSKVVAVKKRRVTQAAKPVLDAEVDIVSDAAETEVEVEENEAEVRATETEVEVPASHGLKEGSGLQEEAPFLGDAV